MMMKDFDELRKLVEIRFAEDDIYHRSKIIDNQKGKEGILKLLDEIEAISGLDPVFKSDPGDFSVGIISIIIHFQFPESARKLAENLMERLSIEKFKKEFDIFGDNPNWYYFCSYNNIGIFIYPCEPSTECIPKKEFRTYHVWSCDRES